MSNQSIFQFWRTIFIIVMTFGVTSQSFCDETFVESDYIRYIKEFQESFGKGIEKEFNLKWKESDHHFFPSISIEFTAYRRATLEEARALQLAILNKLDIAVQKDPEILSSLNKLSLTHESIRVDIHFKNFEGWSFRDGSIENVSSYYNNDFQKRFLGYYTTDPFEALFAEREELFETRFEEPFEEAIKLNALVSHINPAVHEPTDFENELNSILAAFEKEMDKKFNLYFKTSGWMSAGKSASDISEIRSQCTYRYATDCQDARTLLLSVTENLLKALNSSESLRPYLKEYPFPASRLKLRILFRYEKFFVGDSPFYDGSMESTVLGGNKITYYHYIPNVENRNWHDKVIYAKELTKKLKKLLKIKLR